MSIEFCQRCSSHVDTDHSVEGEYSDDGYTCERCVYKRAEAQPTYTEGCLTARQAG